MNKMNFVVLNEKTLHTYYWDKNCNLYVSAQNNEVLEIMNGFTEEDVRKIIENGNEVVAIYNCKERYIKEGSLIRFRVNDVIFESEYDNADTQFSGYMWATDVFVDMTNYEEMKNRLAAENYYEDYYINFYPCYDKVLKQFQVIVEYFDVSEKLALSKAESNQLFSLWKSYICETEDMTLKQFISE